MNVKQSALQPFTPTPVASSVLQRKCACGQHTGNGGECEACKKKREATVQRAAVNADPVNEVPAIVHDVLRSTGQPLDAETRAFMEPRFGQDFSGVRVHTDARATESARAVNALAYTVGQDVVFGAGQYAPQSSEGMRLIAHELTHALQQSPKNSLPSKLEIGTSDDYYEKQADTIANQTTQSFVLTKPLHGPTSETLQRKAIHSGNILDEGTCEHLACNSKWACVDATKGVLCPEGTRNAGQKRRPLFTCDRDCKSNATCSDTDDYMAIPHSRMSTKKGGVNYKKCGQDLVICANGRFTHGHVRDRSDKEAWEVSPGIQKALGVKGKFKGVIYGDETDKAFLKDPACGHGPKKSDPKKSAAVEDVMFPNLPEIMHPHREWLQENPSDQVEA